MPKLAAEGPLSQSTDNQFVRLFRAKNGILGSFCDPQFYDRLCGNLELLSGLRIASDTGRPLLLHEFSDAWQSELPDFLCLSIGDGNQRFKNSNSFLLSALQSGAELFD